VSAAKREPSLRERALGILARREHTRAELARRLGPHVEDADQLEALLDELERRKLLSDARYAEARVHTLSRKYGAAIPLVPDSLAAEPAWAVRALARRGNG